MPLHPSQRTLLEIGGLEQGDIAPTEICSKNPLKMPHMMSITETAPNPNKLELEGNWIEKDLSGCNAYPGLEVDMMQSKQICITNPPPPTYDEDRDGIYDGWVKITDCIGNPSAHLDCKIFVNRKGVRTFEGYRIGYAREMRVRKGTLIVYVPSLSRRAECRQDDVLSVLIGDEAFDRWRCGIIWM